MNNKDIKNICCIVYSKHYKGNKNMYVSYFALD